MDEYDIDYAEVRVENEALKIIVPVSSILKPEIPQYIKEKWQNILDLIAEIMDVPASLIMKLEKDKILVFLNGNTENTPYKENAFEKLGMGLYCETVVGKREELLVPNALKLDYWKENPDIKLNMISYLGLPVKWSDGEVFGTFCVLDNKENNYSKQYRLLLHQFRDIVEQDMLQLETMDFLETKVSQKELSIRELHHNIKNQFNLLVSLIRLDGFESNSDYSIEKITNRIIAMSQLHDKLYQLNDRDVVYLKDHIKDLAEIMVSNFSQLQISLNVKGDTFKVMPDHLLSCGIIISELITNSVKYAFKGIESPELTIEIKKENSETFAILYKDNGLGFNEDIVDDSESLGKTIVRALTKQHGGELNISSNNGAEYNFIFPLQ